MEILKVTGKTLKKLLIILPIISIYIINIIFLNTNIFFQSPQRPITKKASIAFFFFFWLCHMACGILVPGPGNKHMPPAVEVQNPNHWTTR